jgi:hypothetical protein
VSRTMDAPRSPGLRITGTEALFITSGTALFPF